MNLYIVGIIILSILVIVCICLLVYFIKDEKNLKEVTTDDLVKLGKVYTKEEFEEKMFNQYVNVIQSIQFSNYVLLKDIVSDDMYNQILINAKYNQEKNQFEVIDNIKKDFSKLISFKVINDLEVVKLWIRYSSYEYIKSNRKNIDENGIEVLEEVIVSGSTDNLVNNEYILTFVKNRVVDEKIVCPTCGYQEHLLTSSNCIRCDSEIIPKKMHWVLVDKVTTNISKQ